MQALTDPKIIATCLRAQDRDIQKFS